MSQYRGEFLTPKVIDYFQQHPGFILTASYLLLSVLGMFYHVTISQHFGLSILSFAEISDLASVGFKEPAALLGLSFGVGIFLCWDLLMAAGYRFRVRMQKSPRKWLRVITLAFTWTPEKASTVSALALIFFLIWIFAGITLFGGSVARQIKQQRPANYELQTADGERRQIYLLSTTVKFLIAYLPAEQKVEVYNLEGIEVIRPLPDKR